VALKITAWIVLIAFALFDCSCVVHRVTAHHRSEILDAFSGGQIISVLTLDGRTILFSEDKPAIIVDDTIVGIQEDYNRVDLAKSQTRLIRRDRYRRIEKVFHEDGTRYNVAQVIRDTSDSLSFYERSIIRIEIPISEVDVVRAKRIDEGGTFIATLGGIALFCAAIVVVIAATKESCPFIYSFDGEEYHFDAEPYGGATCEGLKRTEWCALENLQAVDNSYHLRLTNEVHETQYTDELKLVVVDHPGDIRVAPDTEGTFVSFAHVIPPFKAYEADGRDITRYVDTNDWIFWESKINDRSIDMESSVRETLTFHFPKPREAKRVKVLVNACTTLWGSQMIRRLLEIHGDKVDDWYSKINMRGIHYDLLQEWSLREECFLLKLRVQTVDGWQARSVIVGGGPFASEDKAYVFDISDVPGDTLTFRLTPPPLFWMINFLGVDYSDTEYPIHITELTAENAVDHEGHDVRAELAATDGNYLTMPTIGERTEIAYLAPSKKPGMARSLFAKASGYYDIHLDKEGFPNSDLIARLGTVPGTVATFAIEEYLEWRESLMADH